MLPFDVGGLLFGRVLQAVHGRGVHKIAQVGASGGRRPIGASKSGWIGRRRRRRRAPLVALFVAALLPPPQAFRFADYGSGRAVAALQMASAQQQRLTAHHRHSGRPRIIDVVAPMDKERIDFPRRCDCHHRSMSTVERGKEFFEMMIFLLKNDNK